jgi:hypothetical protein
VCPLLPGILANIHLAGSYLPGRGYYNILPDRGYHNIHLASSYLPGRGYYNILPERGYHNIHLTGSYLHGRGYYNVSFTYTNTGHISTGYRFILPVDTYSQKDVSHSFWQGRYSLYLALLFCPMKYLL